MPKKDDSYNLRKIFEQIEFDLVASMSRNLKRHEQEEEKEGFKWEQWQSAKLRNLRLFRKQNKQIVEGYSKEINSTVSDSLKGNYKEGQNIFKRAVHKIASLFSADIKITVPLSADEGQENIPFEDKTETQEDNFFHMNDKKLDALEKSVKNDLDKAQHSVLRKIEDVYRKVIFNAETHMTAGAKSLNQAIDLAAKDFLAQGINCIQYKNGRLVNIASYAEMALRTASHRATLMGEGKQRDKFGIYTVVVTAHGNTCPLCEPWQGKVLIDDVFTSLTAEKAQGEEKETGHTLLSTAIRSGLLHPNCRHGITTFFPGISSLPTVPDGEEAIRKYKAEQEQRRIERLIRKWKRIAAGSLDPQNIGNANQQVKKYQAELREHLKENPYLRRDYSREQTRNIPTISKNDAGKLLAENKEYIEKYETVRYNEDGTVKITDDWKDRGHIAIPKQYKPNAIIETLSRQGKQVDRMVYDATGKQRWQINSGHHGNPKRHSYGKNGEHIHDILWADGKIISRIARELTEIERKEHGDIL